MSVNIILGRSGSGKTESCISNIEHLAKTEKNIYCIVPDQLSHKRETVLAERLGACFEGSVSAITFKRLANRIFERSGRVKPLSASGKSMLVMRAVYLEKKNLTLYKNSADKFGFVKKMSDIISELKRYGVSPDMLSGAAQKSDDEGLKAKMGDIARIYERYNKLFGGEYTDSEDDLFYAAAKLSGIDYLKGAHIFIDEFSDFLPSHYEIIEVLMKRAASVSFYFTASKPPYDDGCFFAQEANTVERIKAMCYRTGQDLKITYLDKNERHARKGDFLALERGYSEYKIEPYGEKCDNISIFQASDMFSELEYAAGEIRALCRSGYRWRDICVCAGDTQLYEKAIGQIFNMYGVPYFISSKTSTAENPMVEAILAVFDIFVHGYDYESVFLYLKSGFSNINPYQVDILENYVLEAGIGKKHWLSDEPWKFKKKIAKSEDGEEAEAEFSSKADEIRRKAVAPLAALREKLGVRHTVREAAAAVFEFMEEIGMAKKVYLLSEKLKKEGDLARANLFIKTYNGILGVLDQAVTMAGDDKIGIEQMSNMLRAGFENENISLIPQTVDEVLVCSAGDARAADCKVMIAIGTNRGDFAGAAGGEGVISDAEREKLEALGIVIAPTQKKKLSDSREVIYRAITKPADRLYLTYSLSDFEGEAQNESQLCEKVRKILPQIKVLSNTDKTVVYSYQYEGKGPAYLNMCVAMATNAAGDTKQAIWRGIHRILSEDGEFKEKVAKAESALKAKNEAKNISPVLLDKMYPKGFNSTVSRLETYNKCPFSYFIKYTLNAKERKILKIGAPDIGNIMHAVLETFIKQCVAAKVDFKTLDESKTLAMLKQITAEHYGGILKNSSADTKANRYLLKRIELNLARCAMLVVAHISRGVFEPVECELKFGTDHKIDAVVIDITSGKKLKIHGIIDRLDKCVTDSGEVFWRVIDYKSGSKDFSLDKVYHGLDLQLALYLHAVCREDGKPAGMLYFKIKEPLVESDSILTKEAADAKVKDEMRMDGLVLADTDVVKMMDSKCVTKSDILPVSLKKNGEFYAYSKVATAKDFERIFKHIKKQLKQIGTQIAGGKINISPCMYSGSAPCDYCEYSAVCRFDKKNGVYKGFKKYKKEEVIDSLKRTYGKGDGK